MSFPRSATRSLLLAGAAWLLPALAASAAEDPATPSAATAAQPAAASATEAASLTEAASVSELVVTGLRGGLGKTVIDSPAPIDVVRSAELTQTGKVGLKEVLNNLVPSFNLPGVNGGGTSWTVRAITLRGLNGDQALFLVNGKRRHNTALINNLARVGNGGVPVDLDLIPVGAIDHIEVLRDGAAAQYGSDAIAGVINIILKSGVDGGGIDVTAGQNYLGDGAVGHVATHFGTAIGQGGFLDVAFDAKANRRASRSVATSLAHIYNPLPNGQPDPRDLTADRYFYGHSYGPGEEQIYSASYNAELPVGDLTLYSFSTYSYRDATKNTGSFLPNNINSLPEIYPNGFNALRRIYESDYQATGGARGKLGGWDWDISTTYGRDGARLDAKDTLNATLGPTSPTSFNLSTHVYDQWTNTLDLTRQVNWWLERPLTVSIGAEHRWEKFQIKPGDPASYAIGDYVIPSGFYAGQHPAPGLASYNGTSPADAGEITRHNLAAYIDLSADLTSNWYFGAAGRFEHYSDSAGDTWSGKLSTRYEFLPGYAIRGTVSNGFRAPSLAQTIFASSTVTGQIAANGEWQTFPIKVLPVYTPEAKALGAEPLTPEKSTNFSLGLTAEPVRSVQLTIDAYQVGIKDRIVQTGLLRGPVVAAILQAGGFAPGLTAQYYTNAVDTRTRGVDVVAAYSHDFDRYGQVRLSAAYSWNKTTITRFKPTPTQLANIGYDLFDRQKQADLTIATPRDKVILSGEWRLGRFNASGRATRYGAYTEAATVAANDRTYGAKWVADLDVSFDVTDRTTVGLGANNLFDVYPDRIGIVDAKTGLFQYGSFAPFGITGGFYYARLSQKF